jgi:phosphoglycolate phosphatase-like HAD superfamily hydrolase
LTGNIRAGAGVKLAHYGIDRYFSFGAFGDERLDRDAVAHDALALSRLHVDESIHASRIWVIGDTPLDIQCARAIGARAVAVATGTHTTEELAAGSPDVLLPDLSDATALLSRLEG